MVDAPNSEANHEEAKADLENIGEVRTLPPDKPDSTSPDAEAKHPDNKRHFAQYVVRPLKAVRKSFIAFVNWTDKNNGFVTAVATVAIAILTGFYVHYSGAQWKVMHDQLPDLHISAQTAQRSAKAAEDTVIVSNRPRLDVQVAIAGQMTFDDGMDAYSHNGGDYEQRPFPSGSSRKHPRGPECNGKPSCRHQTKLPIC